MLTVYYDGECGLCEEAVCFFRRMDRRGKLRFERLGEASDSVMVMESGGRTLLRAQAVLRVLAELGGAWKLLGTLGGLVPPRMANAAYDAVARRRKRFCTSDQRSSSTRPRV